MKLITAIVKPERLEDVARAVTGAGARGMTVTEVRGFGQQYGHLDGLNQEEREALMLPKVRVDVVVRAEDAGFVADAIAKATWTGVIGDGKIWICPVDGALRVRTGDRDRDAV